MQLWQLTCEELDSGAPALARCPHCGGSGVTTQLVACFEGDALTDVEQRVACDCRQRAVECLAQANLPDGRFAQASLGSLDWRALRPTRTAIALQRYVERSDQALAQGLGLTLTGYVGTGKTHVAVGLVRLACGLGTRACFYSLPDLLARLKATYDDDHGPFDCAQGRRRRAPRERESDVLEALATVQLLALDDLGAARPNDWLRDRLYSLVNARYVAGRATIVTANEDLATLARCLGQRIVSRLAGASLELTFEGDDYRRRARDAQLERLGLGWAELWSQGDVH
jgi:DNA replication protein DnaC